MNGGSFANTIGLFELSGSETSGTALIAPKT
jgi:hypothetical protein